MNLSSDVYSYEEAAKILTDRLNLSGYKIKIIHYYHNMEGEISYCRIKFTNGKDKKFFPLSIDCNNCYVLKEPKFGHHKKPLYKLPDISKTPGICFVVEGEQCVEALSELGILATTSGGATSAASVDWSILSGREVRIWPDFDAKGITYGDKTALILMQLGCKVTIINLKDLNLESSEDCKDWLEKNPGSTKNDILNLPIIECIPDDEIYSKSDLLLELVKDVDFFHDEQSDSYATVKINLHSETMPIKSNLFNDWLSKIFWEKYHKSISSFGKQSALSVMESKARFDGNCHRVFNRVATHNGITYIFLANEKSQVISISPTGWELQDESPVKFLKTKNMKQLPTPISGGDLNLMWKYILIPKKYRLLVISWVLECFRADTDFPILLLYGPPGSAKSSSQEFLRRLIDPNRVNLRGTPRNSDDISVAAVNNYVISYNNMSNLSKSEHDDLCAVATGGGIGKRKNYTDQEESVCDITRPLIMNGVHNFITEIDLISRSIAIELPEMDEDIRIHDSKILESFVLDQPYILGALYDLMVSVLRILPGIKLSKMPRLADFALLGTAVEQSLNYDQGAFILNLNENMSNSMLDTVDNQPILAALCEFIKSFDTYEGTYYELLILLSPYKTKGIKQWPSTPKIFANILRNSVHLLINMGMDVDFSLKRSRKGRKLRIKLCSDVHNVH